MIYRPENVLFMGVGVYVLIYLLSPLEVLVPMEIGALAFIALTVAALVVGSRSADFFRLGGTARPTSAARRLRKENRLFWATFWLGLAGNLLRLQDKYVLRGVGNLTGIEARETLLETSSTNLSLIGGVLYPFGYLPIFVLLGSAMLPRHRWKLALASFIFLIPALDSLVLFSRSFMLVSLAMVYFGTSLTLFRGRALPRQLLLPAVAGVGAVLTISVLIFLWRLDQMSFDVSDSVFMSGYAYTVAPNAAMEWLINGGGAIGELVSSLLPIAQYYLHSIPEFQILWSMNDTQNFSNGALHLGPYVKLLAMFGLASEPDLFELFPRVGIFTSFWGPLWVDFGWLSLIAMFVFGFMARMIGRDARDGDLGAFPLYTYFCVILFFMPVVNFAISAQGMYVINAFALFWIATRRTARAVLI
ncbi:hypothetical protein ACGYLX_18115 [Sulfitobacter sp. 1A13496]|uniref:hypothetical protein n=1 Tax=Sulfitobacter sp. 1A13496 TaxID=3368596 RepID=UPI0037457421